MDVDDNAAKENEQGADGSAEKPAGAEDETNVPEAMEIHDIDETGDLDKSVAASEKSIDVTLLNSSAIDPFDAVKNTEADADKSKTGGDEKDGAEKDSATAEEKKAASGEESNAADDVELPKLPEVDEDSRPAELDRDAATPDLEDLDEPEESNHADDDVTRDDSPTNDYDAPAEGKWCPNCTRCSVTTSPMGRKSCLCLPLGRHLCFFDLFFV